MKYFIPLIAAIFLFTACDDAQTVVKETPSFSELKDKKNEHIYNLVTTEGKKITLEYAHDILTSKDLNGKIVLINFFATWCPPCKKEIPVFNQLVKKYPDDFVVLSILFQDTINISDLKKFMQDYEMSFDVTVGGDNARLAKAFNNVQKIPESYLFTNDGVLIEKFLGAVDEEALDYLIEKLKK
ncbi:TlpA family protein disulfide reductase [Arcobacter sp.]|uniref:TlpA family protein disulfide reductase n=1 Tax=Arcobacter sp. TaxID=1872629 RepID=UPI003D0C4F8A